MAIDLFLKIDGIEGESSDYKHPKEIQLESFTWGLQQVGNLGVGAVDSPLALPARKGGAKASFQDFSFVHRIDKSSPLLAEACATGSQITQAVLVVRRAGSQAQEFYKVTLSDVTVTGVSLATTYDNMMETVSFRYGSIKIEYAPQKPNGSLDTPIITTLQTK